MPTLIDVARAAGVSRSTASNVYAHPELVRAEVRDRVERIAREIGYDGPDPRGKLLREGKFNAIGFVGTGNFSITNIISAHYGRELLMGIASACDDAGISLTMISGIDERRGGGIRNALVDGFILGLAGDLELIEQANKRGLPFAVMDFELGPLVNSVNIEARAGARMAVEHLVALGHRKFVIVAIRRKASELTFHPPGPGERIEAPFPLDREKLAGFRVGLAAAGIAIDSVPIIQTAPWDETVGAIVLDRAPEATAVLAASDVHALAILREAARRGLDVPKKLSVIGFDGLEVGELATPPLTTIAQPTTEKGRIAARLVIDNGPPQQLTLPVKLVVRGSTAAPRKAR